MVPTFRVILKPDRRQRSDRRRSSRGGRRAVDVRRADAEQALQSCAPVDVHALWPSLSWQAVAGPRST
jgi:hypothetical protein